MTATYDVAVAGLGAMGSAVLYHLARAGKRVIGLERYATPHALGSTHGGSRIIREAYFEDPRYVPLVQRAYEAWATLERDSGRRLLLTTGGVMIGPREGMLVSGALASALEHRLAYELIDAREIRRRFPAFAPAPDMVGVWEPRAGVLFPEACVEAHLELAARAGAEIRSEEPLASWRASGGGVEVVTARGVIRAGALVLATGAWLPQHLNGAHLPLAVERVVQAWFEPADAAIALTGSNPLAPERCPITIWEYGAQRYFYSFPLLEGAVKAALHHQGTIVDPETVERAVAPDEIERIHEPLRRFMPAAAGRLREARVCLYTNTRDEHFVIDRHPEHRQVVIVSACSGHGFKFASAIGEGVAAMATGARDRFDVGLFPLARFAPA